MEWEQARRLVANNEPLRSFFWAEIRNEDNGGVSPATLSSAFDSLTQAPDYVINGWFDRVPERGLVGFAQVVKLVGWDAELYELLPMRRHVT